MEIACAVAGDRRAVSARAAASQRHAVDAHALARRHRIRVDERMKLPSAER